MLSAMRRGSLLALTLLAAASAACTSRRGAEGGYAPPTPTASEDSGDRRSGWSSLSGRVRVRDDTPPLSDVLAAQRPPPRMADDAYGPRGEEGATWSNEGPYPYPPPGTWVPGYFGPAGWIPPFLVPPPRDEPPGPFAAPYVRSSPSADVTQHRPGLSVGTGVYGRDDEPAPAPPPEPHGHHGR